MLRTTIAVAVALACLLPAMSAPAMAQRDRVFVASYGSDSNPCTFGSPCKTFQQAVNVVADGGEVTAIDSAGFGPILIQKAVTITSPDGVEAGIVAPSGGTAITITAGASDAVILHGLTIDGAGTAANGILFNGGAILEVTNCIARNFTESGLAYSTSSSTTFKVTNSEFDDNGIQGIVISPSATPQITGLIDHVGLYNNFIGLNLFSNNTTGGTVSITVNDSIASNNTNSTSTNGAGFTVQATASQAVSHLMLVKSVATYNFLGVGAFGANAKAFVNGSTITKNVEGWGGANSGVLVSYGNNAVDDNAGVEAAQTPASLK
jgi:hypothetical protein